MNPRPPNQQQTWSDMVGGYGAAALGIDFFMWEFTEF